MRTLIIRATPAVVMNYATRHLESPAVRQVGRLVMLQSPTLNEHTDAELWIIANAYRVPLVKIRTDLAALTPQRALPAARSQ